MKISWVLDLICLSSLKAPKSWPWMTLIIQSKTCPVSSVQTLPLAFKWHFAWRSCGCAATTERFCPCQRAPTGSSSHRHSRTPCHGKGGSFRDYIGIRKSEFIFLLLHEDHVGFVGIHVGCIYLTKNSVFAHSQVLHYLFIWTKDVNSTTKFTKYSGLFAF